MWSLLVGIWGLLKGSWGVLGIVYVYIYIGQVMQVFCRQQYQSRAHRLLPTAQRVQSLKHGVLDPSHNHKSIYRNPESTGLSKALNSGIVLKSHRLII